MSCRERIECVASLEAVNGEGFFTQAREHGVENRETAHEYPLTLSVPFYELHSGG
jgi:hypothetical protein